METRDQGSTGDEGDHLDDWFTRRLQSHGIPVRGARKPPIPRVLTLVGLAIALLAMFWALSAVQNHTTSSSTPPATTTGQSGTTSTNGTSGTSGTSGSTQSSQAAWKNVTVDVLNGYGGTNAAATAVSTLRTGGYKIGSYGNGGTQTTNTVVIFTAGHRADAKLIAKQLGLGVIPVVLAHGVQQTAVTDGVAILLGPNWTSKISTTTTGT